MGKNYIDKAIEIAEKLGWSVKVDETTMEFSKPSPCGQDFSFSVDLYSYGDMSDLYESINEYADDFDVDYESYLWIGSDGHGKNGAPYHIKDIVTDMEKVLESIEELASAIYQAV